MCTFRKNDTLGEINFDNSFVSVANTSLLKKTITPTHCSIIYRKLGFGGVHIFSYFANPGLECSNSVGRVFELGLKGCMFETHQSHCGVSLSKTLYLLLSTALIQKDRKWSQHEKLLTGK